MMGVGGRTIEEAQQAMSYREFLGWIKYREKYGPLNASVRLETSLAMLMAQQSRSGEIIPFLPFRAQPENTDQPDNPSIVSVFSMLKNVSKKGEENGI